MEDKIEMLRKWIDGSNNIVAFTGAGCSTESGIIDFRGENGLFTEKVRTNYTDTTLLGTPDSLHIVVIFTPLFMHSVSMRWYKSLNFAASLLDIVTNLQNHVQNA